MHLSELNGRNLGMRVISYQATDAALYALAVGAPEDRLDLVYERDLRVLPAFACARALWAVEAAGGLGAYDRTRSLHAAQRLVVHHPLPRSGEIMTAGRVAGVWDRGKAAVVDIEVSCEYFTATYAIYLPGLGGWGGEKDPAAPGSGTTAAPTFTSTFQTLPSQAAWYRLTGDLHPIHIDPATARNNGFDRPILHGLCTLGIAARAGAEAVGAHPADLAELECRLAAPVMPGEEIRISANGDGNTVNFEANVGERTVLKGGRAVYRPMQ